MSNLSVNDLRLSSPSSGDLRFEGWRYPLPPFTPANLLRCRAVKVWGYRQVWANGLWDLVWTDQCSTDQRGYQQGIMNHVDVDRAHRRWARSPDNHQTILVAFDDLFLLGQAETTIDIADALNQDGVKQVIPFPSHLFVLFTNGCVRVGVEAMDERRDPRRPMTIEDALREVEGGSHDLG